jgi:predicted nucleic acid-binding protein
VYTGTEHGNLSVSVYPVIQNRPQVFITGLDQHTSMAEASRDAVNNTLATDALAARKMATERGVPVTGSVGVLVVSIRRGKADTGTANRWLDNWRATRGYYAPVKRIEEALG